VSLTRDELGRALARADRGQWVGFDPQRLRPGLGLVGIRERASSLGGELRIDIGAGAGNDGARVRAVGGGADSGTVTAGSGVKAS
jgi:glucose-6-phosphate-specific signal transduction histidine kinase